MRCCGQDTARVAVVCRWKMFDREAAPYLIGSSPSPPTARNAQRTTLTVPQTPLRRIRRSLPLHVPHISLRHIACLVALHIHRCVLRTPDSSLGQSCRVDSLAINKPQTRPASH
jgi:hypothetical protein